MDLWFTEIMETWHADAFEMTCRPFFQEQEEKAKAKPIAFTISPETLTNIKEVITTKAKPIAFTFSPETLTNIKEVITAKAKPIAFTISPETLTNIKEVITAKAKPIAFTGFALGFFFFRQHFCQFDFFVCQFL